MARQRVLILCTGNSCRSQMAEGWITHDLGGQWEAASAGTEPATEVHPLAIAAMSEAGVDISEGTPEHLDLHLDREWDLVITVCDSAKDNCPHFPGGGEVLHISFPDPADAEGAREEKMAVFRAVRDDIRQRLVPEVARRTGSA